MHFHWHYSLVCLFIHSFQKTSSLPVVCSGEWGEWSDRPTFTQHTSGDPRLHVAWVARSKSRGWHRWAGQREATRAEHQSSCGHIKGNQMGTLRASDKQKSSCPGSDRCSQGNLPWNGSTKSHLGQLSLSSFSSSLHFITCISRWFI